MQNQWVHSTTAAIPYSEKYKSSKINYAIPPQQQTLLQKNTNHPLTMSQFYHYGNTLFRKKILHYQCVNTPLRQSSTQKNTNNPKSVSQFQHCGKPLLRKIQIIQHQWCHSTTAANPSSEKHKSSTINESILSLQQSLVQKKKSFNISESIHHCGNPLSRKTQIIQKQSVNSTTALIPY